MRLLALLPLSLVAAFACDGGLPGAEDAPGADQDGQDLLDGDYDDFPLDDAYSTGGLGGEGTCDEVPLGGEGGLGGGGSTPAAPLQLPGCPLSEPEVSACSEPARSVECLYPAEGLCYRAWRCELGIWSPAGERCPEETIPLLEDSSAACPAVLPVATAPCAEYLTCEYSDCGGWYPSHLATCRCGRWEVERHGCPSVP